VRGYRIELGEIESQLRAHAAVREAVVVAREEGGGQKRLVGYYVAEAGGQAEVQGLNDRLRDHLRERLPEYMVPAALVRLDALPLTANGKVDRRALPAIEGEAYARGQYEEPRGEVEGALAQIWQHLLGVERVGRQDNFFELGGHSLLAVTLIERMRQKGLRTDVRTLFDAPTLWKLAGRIGGDVSGDVEIPDNKIPQPQGKPDTDPSDLIEIEI
jgi:aryl carrier-like protein